MKLTYHISRVMRLKVSTGSGSDRVANYHTIEIERVRPGRYRSRY
jgi:hypothetical protein